MREDGVAIHGLTAGYAGRSTLKRRHSQKSRGISYFLSNHVRFVQVYKNNRIHFDLVEKGEPYRNPVDNVNNLVYKSFFA